MRPVPPGFCEIGPSPRRSGLNMRGMSCALAPKAGPILQNQHPQRECLQALARTSPGRARPRRRSGCSGPLGPDLPRRRDHAPHPDEQSGLTNGLDSLFPLTALYQSPRTIVPDVLTPKCLPTIVLPLLGLESVIVVLSSLIFGGHDTETSTRSRYQPEIVKATSACLDR